MRIVSVGGGPAGLYFSILMKKAHPDCEIRVIERNRADDTFGWGVVFSDETLGNFEVADPESFAAIRASFRTWSDIRTHYGGECVTSTGHGFCGLSRKRLLEILHARARELGVALEFQREVKDLAELEPCDLVLAADGVNSGLRERFAEHFRPKLAWGECKFCWLGLDKELEAFTFVFRESPHGLFQVHAYPFEAGRSTWIVECREEVWKRAGLEHATEADTVAFVSELFADHLEGHRLLTNRSLWRTFPTVTNERWHHGKVVLIGDAAHTAHFSIGSGTKLAMEDAIALVDAFREHGTDGPVERVLEAYHEARRVDVLKTQKAAQTSLEWFEHSARYLGQDPVLFQFNLMTRSKRITYDNLKLRDPELVARVDEQFRVQAGAPKDSTGRAPAPLFTPFRLRGVELANRMVVSPMCQYSAVDGTVNDWHLVHLGSRAIGGAGLVMSEMTDVSAEGRISLGCAGMYREEHVGAWKRVVDFVHANSGAKIGIQLAHAGRKGSCRKPWEPGEECLRESAWTTLGPSALPFRPSWPAPRAMQRADMERVRDEFALATERAVRAGFDLIELHLAHGYLLSSFLSPLSNQRRDEYGGSLGNRMRYPLEVFEAVRAAAPSTMPVIARLSASDWLGERGFTPDEAVVVSRALKERGCDLIDVSSGGNSPESRIEYGRMYQVPFAEQVRYEAAIPVMSVGAILGADHANTILAAGRADLCALARPHLRDPYLTLQASIDYAYPDQAWPNQYLPARPQPPAD